MPQISLKTYKSMLNVLFLASGNGGTIKFLHQAIKVLKLPIRITALIADRDCGALEFAKQLGIVCHKVDYSRTSPHALRQTLSSCTFDLAVTNFHKIIDEETLSHFQGKFINVHYSLLPAFGALIGMKTLDAAKKANAKFIGTSCHIVTPQVDAGELIGQSILPVHWTDDSLQELITITFQSACLVFLNALVSSKSACSKATLLSKEVTFNPGLAFDISLMDEAFWQQVSAL